MDKIESLCFGQPHEIGWKYWGLDLDLDLSSHSHDWKILICSLLATQSYLKRVGLQRLRRYALPLNQGGGKRPILRGCSLRDRRAQWNRQNLRCSGTSYNGNKWFNRVTSGLCVVWYRLCNQILDCSARCIMADESWPMNVSHLNKSQ